MNFIKNIKIKSFFSIKNEITIDFDAMRYTINHYQNRVMEYNDKYYNKTVALYGANATGKTSILKAIIVIAAIINNEKKDALPFSIRNLFDKAKEKTTLNINFVIENKEFEYEVILKANKDGQNISISNEKLFLIANDKKSIIFDRQKKVSNLKKLVNSQNKEILTIEHLFQKVIFSNLEKTISLFDEFEKFDNSHTLRNIRKFFKSILETTNIEQPYTTSLGITFKDEFKLAAVVLEDKKLKSFIIDFLDSIGIDIEDIQIEFEKKQNTVVGVKNIFIYHKVDKKIPLDYKFESDGTKQLFRILIYVYFTYKNKSILVIDEFDNIIHPIFVPIIIDFLQKQNIQFFYSTHNIYNLKYLYGDEIIFVKKDKNHNTQICSPKEFGEIEGYENFLSLYENDMLCGLPKFFKNTWSIN